MVVRWPPLQTLLSRSFMFSRLPFIQPFIILRNVDYAAQALYHPASLSCMLPVTPTDHRHPSDAHSTPWPSGAEAASARAYAPQIAWRDESNLGPTQRDRSQVPSGPTNLDTFGQSWSQRGDDRHAVQALAVPEPVFPRNTHHPQYPVPALSYTPALPQGVISTGHASLGNFGPWVADLVLRQAPSPSKRRRYHDNPGPRPHVSQQPVTCEKCKKSMRRQSLRRHIREVHDHIKRPHPKSRFEAQSGP